MRAARRAATASTRDATCRYDAAVSSDVSAVSTTAAPPLEQDCKLPDVLREELVGLPRHAGALEQVGLDRGACGRWEIRGRCGEMWGDSVSR